MSQRRTSRLSSTSSFLSTTSSVYIPDSYYSESFSSARNECSSSSSARTSIPSLWSAPQGESSTSTCTSPHRRFSRANSTLSTDGFRFLSHVGSDAPRNGGTSYRFSSLLASDVFEQTNDGDKDDEADDTFWGREQSSRMKKYKLRVLRDLLKNFRLEDRINHYRTLSVVSYPLHPKDYSLNSAMETSQKRERLVRFTGSDQVRVNDRRYMDMLCEKMRKEAETQMRKDEEKRAEAERQRLRRLLAQGIITMDDMEHDSALYREMKEKEQNRRGRKNNKRGESTKRQRTTQSSRTSPSRKPPPTPRSSKPSYAPPPKNDSSGNTNNRNKSDKKERTDTPPAEVESQMSRLDEEGENEKEKQDEQKEDGDVREENGEEEIQEEGQQGDNGDNPDDDSQERSNNTQKKPLFERYEDPRVQQMREEESVDALYQIADELIIPSSIKPKPKKTTPKENS